MSLVDRSNSIAKNYIKPGGSALLSSHQDNKRFTALLSGDDAVNRLVQITSRWTNTFLLVLLDFSINHQTGPYPLSLLPCHCGYSGQ